MQQAAAQLSQRETLPQTASYTSGSAQKTPSSQETCSLSPSRIYQSPSFPILAPFNGQVTLEAMSLGSNRGKRVLVEKKALTQAL